jgi:hypothetical protein
VGRYQGAPSLGHSHPISRVVPQERGQPKSRAELSSVKEQGTRLRFGAPSSQSDFAACHHGLRLRWHRGSIELMAHVLDGCFEKIKRAGEHIETFKAEADPADPDDPVSFEVEAEFAVHPRGEAWMIMRCIEAPEARARWGVLIGDVTHCLRSALDHLAWQLALHNRPGKKPSRSTRFPICRAPGDWKGKGTNEALTHIHPTHRAIIERYQPYKRGNQMKTHPLAILNSLSNTDKHQIIVPLVAAVADVPTKVIKEAGGQVDSLKVNIGVPLTAGAEIFRFRMLRTDLTQGEMDVQFRFDLYIALPDRSRVDQTLESIQSYVADVISEFKGLL